MNKLKFESAQEMVCWLMDNESKLLIDNYGRAWRYENYKFYFQDLGAEFTEKLSCLHLFQTDLYGQIL